MSQSSQYIPLARKYRPKLLADVFGQDVLNKVLNYSIGQNKLVSSFLFTGIRGVGKTTSARIIAQAVNCTNLKIENEIVAACLECANCQAFMSQAHPDVVEIDAASYTGIDNIRDVIEKAVYMPVLGKYKVFIIDEVHMLSKSAFNALLKTLEEPPLHVIFILLTTELSKVPITILSRCQKFNLKRLGVSELTALLAHICSSEGLEYDRLALENIAYKADGSARDAIVLLEQIIFLACQKHSAVTIDIAAESLDLNICKHAIDLLKLILRQDASEAMDLVQRLYNNNFDFINITQTLIELVALLSKLKLVPNYDLGYYRAYSDNIEALIADTDLAFLTSLWQILNKGVAELTASLNQLVSFEMLVIKAIYCSMLPSPEEAVSGNPRRQIESPVKVLEIEPRPKSIAKPSVVSGVDEKLLYDFIKYLHENHILEVYHFVMNKCEITGFVSGVLQFDVLQISSDIRKQIEDALEGWIPVKWQVLCNAKMSINSLQQKLQAGAIADENYKLVASFFPDVKLTDVWFNFKRQ